MKFVFHDFFTNLAYFGIQSKHPHFDIASLFDRLQSIKHIMHILNFIPLLFIYRTVTNWTDEKDLLLLKEMGGQAIFEYKAGRRERGGV